MGVYFFVIADDFSSPVRQVDSTYRMGRYTNAGRLRRLVPSVRSNRPEGDRSGEPINEIVSRICSTIGRASLDALFIVAHGHLNADESRRDGYTESTIKLGRGLTQLTAGLFSRIRYLWSQEYHLGDYPESTNFRIIVPRIELHVCYAGEVWNQQIARALARAAGVPVFASASAQMVENLSFEGRVLRFNPPGSVA